MKRVKVYNGHTSDHKMVTVPTHWKVVAKGSIQKGDKVYHYRQNHWMDVWVQISRPVSLFNLVIRPVPTGIGWNISNIIKKGVRHHE